MLTARQHAILNLLGHHEQGLSTTHLMALAFLFAEESDTPANHAYEFVPYNDGPYSFTLCHDLAKMERDGLVSLDEKGVSLLTDGRDASFQSPQTVRSTSKALCRRLGDVSSAGLTQTVRARYPWYTRQGENDGGRVEARPEAPLAVYTAGYQGLMVDGFMSLLISRGIKTMVDTRSNPVARRYGFHKSTMQKIALSLGIAYVHMPALGVPSAWRKYLQDLEDYSALFRRYRAEVLPGVQRELVDLSQIVTSSPTVVFCFEEDLQYCHRTVLAEELGSMTSLPHVELREQRWQAQRPVRAS